MAPLCLSVSQLQHTYCPLSTRSGHLPGRQARVVPCTRVAKAISRQHFVVRAVSETEEVMTNGADGAHGAVEVDRLEGASRATRAVHGGERAGRPRVSGGWEAGTGCMQPCCGLIAVCRPAAW